MPRGRPKKPVKPDADVAVPKLPEVVKETMEQKLPRGVWTRLDPEIPKGMKGKMWVAVFKCSSGHKTKATNLQADQGIDCNECGADAEIIEAFRKPPVDQSRKIVKEDEI